MVPPPMIPSPVEIMHSVRIPAILCLCITITSLASGCQHAFINASELSRQHMAMRPVAVHRLDLTRISRSKVGDATVAPGDHLKVSIATGLELNGQPKEWVVQVSEEGTADVPLIGPVKLAGHELGAAKNIISQASITREIYTHPNVAVDFKKRNEISVTVMGAVAKPGEYKLSTSNKHLVAAIVASGGLSEKSDRFVEIRHPESQFNTVSQTEAKNPFMTIDLVKASQTGAGDFELKDGSVVFVHEKEPEWLFVQGLVKKPGEFELPPGRETRLLDALSMAGGRTLEIADKVNVIRQLPNNKGQIVIRCSVRNAKGDSTENVLLTHNDVVSVEETPMTATAETFKNIIRVSLGASAFRN